MAKWLGLVAGGVLGTVTRYLVSGWTYALFGSRFPYGTLVVNLSGCFLIGFLASAAEAKFLLSPHARVLLMAGFCGAYTTFSTFMLETDHLLKNGEILPAFLNVAVSVTAGFVFYRAGAWLAEIL